MRYLFDLRGWYAGAVANYSPRSTDVAPPDCGSAPVVGAPWPNWTGHEWVLATYSTPIAPDPKPDQRAAILATLADVDKATGVSRAVREALLGNPAALQIQEDKAVKLRSDLAKIA